MFGLLFMMHWSQLEEPLSMVAVQRSMGMYVCVCLWVYSIITGGFETIASHIKKRFYMYL